MMSRRLQEGIAVLRHALELAEKHDLPEVALRARFNLAGVALASDRFEDAVDEVNEGLAVARERGDRSWEIGLSSQVLSALAILGRWDECMAFAAPLLALPPDLNSVTAAAWVSTIAAARGDEASAERCRELAHERRESAHVDERASVAMVHARDAIEQEDFDDALKLARANLDVPTTGHENHEQTFALAVEAALATTDDDALATLSRYVDDMRPAYATPVLRACRARLRAEAAHRRGDSSAAEELEREAIGLLRSVGARPLLAQTLIERHRRRADEDALAEARAIYADLGAANWLSRIDEPSGLAA
jgi:tetratricopeptide (TPR) repeat protein